MRAVAVRKHTGVAVGAALFAVAAMTPAHGMSIIDCKLEQRELTAAVREDFRLDELLAFLAQPYSAVGYVQGDSPASMLSTVGTAPIEVTVELGELVYGVTTVDNASCADTVHTTARLRADIGDGFLSFDAEGFLSIRRGDVSARLYGDADLADAGGTFEPRLDTTRSHLGNIDVSMSVYPGHLRGTVGVGVTYFEDDAQLRRHKAECWIGGEYQRLFGLALGFPADGCTQEEVPFADDVPIALLNEQTSADIRARAAQRVLHGLIVDAVWRDSSVTQVEFDLGEPVGGTACLGTPSVFPPMPGRQLRIPIAGHVRSSDRLVDLPLKYLSAIIGEDGTIDVVMLGGGSSASELSDAARRALGSDVDRVSVGATYHFDGDTLTIDGMVDLREEDRPGGYARTNCLAFPPDGKQDIEDCRYHAKSPMTALSELIDSALRSLQNAVDQ